MDRVVPFSELPGHEAVSRFEGREYGSPVSFFVSGNPPGTGATLHRHHYTEIFIIERGSATFTVDGEQIEARAGEIVVVPAGAVHGFVSSGEETLWQTGIHPSDHVIGEDLEP